MLEQVAPLDYGTSRRFRGINQWMQPGDLAPGEMVDAQNVLVRGSEIVSRPGRQGVLTAAHSAPVYLLGSFRKADGSTGVIYTSGGKVYSAAKSAVGAVSPTPTEILIGGASLALNSATAIGCRLGKFFYFCDGQAARPLYRTDLTSITATIGQVAPTGVPIAAPISTLIDALTGGTWTPDTLTGAGQANRLPNSNFVSTVGAGGGWGGGGGPTGWSPFGLTPDLGSPPTLADLWLLLDNPGEGMTTTAALLNDTIAADASRAAGQFYIALNLFQGDPSGASSCKVGIFGYSDIAGTILVGEITHEFTVPYSGGVSYVFMDTIVSLAAFSTPILSYRVQLIGGASNIGVVTSTAQPGLYVKYPVCFPFAPLLSATVSAAQVRVTQPQTLAYTGGFTATSSTPGMVGSGRGAGGMHLSRDYGAGSPQNWAAYSNVVLGLGEAAGITGLSLLLGFRQTGSATRYYSNPFTISADGLTATCDISTIPAAIRGAFRYLELVFASDFSVPPANGNDLLLFGPLTGAGSLSIGYSDVSYVYTEVNGSTDLTSLVDVIESNPSTASNPLTPTILKAEVALTLPTVPTNSATTHLAVYRYGGVFQDNPAVARLIAVVSLTADMALGADARNPGYSWNHATGLLTDNTPDSFLLMPGVFPNSATAMIAGRDLPPLGISALCAYHGRLFAAVGSTVSASWLVVPTNPSALYFTLAQFPGDPNAAIKGATFPAGGAFDNDPVQALVPTNTAIVIEKMTSKMLLQGYDGQTFNVQDYLKGTGVGCLGIRAACLLQNREIALSTSGVFGFNVAEVEPLSQPIEALLRPKGYDGNPALSPAALSGAAMCEFDRRLLLSAPMAASDTLNTVTYVYDHRTQGWTRWMFGATSFATLSSATDAGDCFAGGYDGMLYQMTGNADRASAAATVTGIPISVTSRGFGQETDQYFWAVDEMSYISALVTAPTGTALTFTTANDTGLTQVSPGQTVGAGTQTLVRIKAGNLRGMYLTVTLAASVAGLFKLTALRAEIAEGRRGTSA